MDDVHNIHADLKNLNSPKEQTFHQEIRQAQLRRGTLVMEESELFEKLFGVRRKECAELVEQMKRQGFDDETISHAVELAKERNKRQP